MMEEKENDHDKDFKIRRFEKLIPFIIHGLADRIIAIRSTIIEIINKTFQRFII